MSGDIEKSDGGHISLRWCHHHEAYQHGFKD